MILPSPKDQEDGHAPLGLLIFLAMMMSIVALTIDAILPAVDGISADLGFQDDSDRQLLILVVFLGLGLGQPVFGPVSDAIGRRNAALIGWAIYLLGTVIAMAAPGLETILLGRFLQGIGAAGPRIVATAIVRDLYEGRPMARIMSLIMTVFMLVPMIAPLIGQQLEGLGGWRAIFVLYLSMALACGIWHLAIPETLASGDRQPLSLGPVMRAFAEVLTTRTTMIYTLATSAVFGAFAALLASAQQVFEELLGLGQAFPLAFASVAALFALAQFTNSRLVMRLGMRWLCRTGAILMILGAGTGLVACLTVYGPVPPLWLFMLTMAPVFLGTGTLFSNLTALSLEPMGHIAGTASSVVMSISTLLAVPMGLLIARQVDDTIVPIFAGFAGLTLVSLILIVLADRVRAT